MSRFQSFFLDSAIDFIHNLGKAAWGQSFHIGYVDMHLLCLFLLSKMFIISCTPEGVRSWMSRVCWHQTELGNQKVWWCVMVPLLSGKQKSLQQGQNLMQSCVGCCVIAFSSAGWLFLPQGHTKCMPMSNLGGNCFNWTSVFIILNVCQPGSVAPFTKYKIVLFYFLLLLFYFGLFVVVVVGFFGFVCLGFFQNT